MLYQFDVRKNDASQAGVELPLVAHHFGPGPSQHGIAPVVDPIARRDTVGREIDELAQRLRRAVKHLHYPLRRRAIPPFSNLIILPKSAS